MLVIRSACYSTLQPNQVLCVFWQKMHTCPSSQSLIMSQNKTEHLVSPSALLGSAWNHLASGKFGQHGRWVGTTLLLGLRLKMRQVAIMLSRDGENRSPQEGCRVSCQDMCQGEPGEYQRPGPGAGSAKQIQGFLQNPGNRKEDCQPKSALCSQSKAFFLKPDPALSKASLLEAIIEMKTSRDSSSAVFLLTK